MSKLSSSVEEEYPVSSTIGSLSTVVFSDPPFPRRWGSLTGSTREDADNIPPPTLGAKGYDSIHLLSPVSYIDIALDALTRFASYDAGWDGYMAERPQQGALLLAGYFLSNLNLKSSSKVFADLHADGRAVIALFSEHGSIEITFSNDSIAWAADGKDIDAWGEDKYARGSTIPSELVELCAALSI
ncbi:hypothetical protein [Oharaeibacter diazotrophicus]|uniref:hypothetical protein n=2 Tax=Oharaeibacter diazotrophicus TaxID=1920512 RepID=UPI00235C9A00|nr:hypothetical protein [Oharaeibacter diazotrophicus]GLS75923.1 hypothetical protein GCM10007904_12580 [Oharaeibacter diazotrophicus]